MTSPVGHCLVSDENREIPIRHDTLSAADVEVCRTTVGQNVQLPGGKKTLTSPVGHCLVSDENREISIRHNTLSAGDIEVCLTTVGQSVQLLGDQTDFDLTCWTLSCF